MNQPWIYMCSPSRSPLPPPSPSHPSGSSQCTSPEHLSYASNLGWWSVSPLIVYLFQCYSLSTSHPRLLPQILKVCSVHLCLFFCFAYRVIVTIFLRITCIFDDGHSNSLIGVLICIILVTCDVEYLFMYLMTIDASSLEKISTQVSCTVFDWIIAFLLCCMILYIFLMLTT